jgi:hypothetical protein
LRPQKAKKLQKVEKKFKKTCEKDGNSQDSVGKSPKDSEYLRKQATWKKATARTENWCLFSFWQTTYNRA